MLDKETICNEYGWPEDVELEILGDMDIFVLYDDAESTTGCLYLYPNKAVFSRVDVNEENFIIESDAIHKPVENMSHPILDSSRCIDIVKFIRCIGDRSLDTSENVQEEIPEKNINVYKTINGYTRDRSKIEKVNILNPEDDTLIEEAFMIIK